VATPASESFARTFARGLRVIEVIGQSTARQNIAQVSEATNLPRTVVRRLLLTLTELGFVKNDKKDYWLTPKVLRLGLTYLYTLPFWRQSQLVLEDLGTQIKQSCAISVLDGHDIVYIQRFHTKRILAMNLVVGSRLPAYAVSMGRVLLSGLDEAQRKEYFANADIRTLTHRTVVDRQQLMDTIKTVGEQGYAWVDGEFDDAICGLAVPVRDQDNQIIAALNVSLLSGTYSQEQAIAEFLPMLKLTVSHLRAGT